MITINDWIRASILALATACPGAAQSETPPAKTPPGKSGPSPAKGSTTPKPSDPSQKAKPRRPSAAARTALREVAAILKTAKGKKGDARSAVMRRVAEGYEKVASTFAGEPASAGAATFAAAETWRRIGALDAARTCYEKSIAIDAARFQGRATLELAHIARRQKRPDQAIELYTAVARLEPRSGRGHRARLWIARCHEGGGKQADAATAYRRAVEAAATPRQRIAACDRLAGLLVRMKQLDAAAEVIRRAEQASKTGVAGDSPAARRATKSLQKAFAKMASRRALQKATDRANAAHKDARGVEQSRRNGR